MRIAFDIDEVLCDFCTPAVAAMRELHIADLPEDYRPTKFSFQEVLTPDQWSTVFDHLMHQENFWLSLLGYANNIEDLRDYIGRNGEQDIYFVTARHQSLGASTVIQTQLWLAEHEIGALGMPVIVTEDKRSAMIENGIQFSLDDIPVNVRACKSIPGHRAFLLDRSHNQEATDLPRVYSVAEYLLEVEAASVT